MMAQVATEEMLPLALVSGCREVAPFQERPRTTR
jgi:hypothetical protein